MLIDIIKLEKKQIEIANEYNKSPGYISQINKKIKQLKYKPKFIDDRLVCFKCEKIKDAYEFHHNHDTGEQIAIVCHGCNQRLVGDLDYNKHPERMLISFEIDQEIIDDFDKIWKKEGYEKRSPFLRKLIKKVILYNRSTRRNV